MFFRLSPKLKIALGVFCFVSVLTVAGAADVESTGTASTYTPAGIIVAPQAHLEEQAKAREIDSLWDQGKKSQANRLLDKWMSSEKDNPWPWVQAASLSYRSQKYNKSLSYLRKALDKSPNCAEAYYWRGRSYEALNKPLDAANEYRAALMAQGSYPEAQAGLDRVSALLGS